MKLFKEIWLRWTKFDTPKFFVKIRNIGLSITGIAATLAYVPLINSTGIVVIAAAIGSTMAAIAQAAIPSNKQDDLTNILNQNK